MATEIPDWLPSYLAERDAARASEADDVFARLTEREQRLVREAAVMGYVLASLGHREEIPRDRAIVRQVINACQSHADLYPLLGTPSPVEPLGREQSE